MSGQNIYLGMQMLAIHDTKEYLVAVAIKTGYIFLQRGSL
jgi:hypothetical protein